MECYEKWQTLILLYAVVFMGNEVHADHWRTYISCSYQCSDCKKTNKKKQTCVNPGVGGLLQISV